MNALAAAKQKHKKPAAIASAATLHLPVGQSKFEISGSVTITSMPVTPSRIGQQVQFIGAASAGAVFSKTNDPTTPGQMDLGGSNITLGQQDVLILEAKPDYTWVRITSTDN
jgi:hypothetical protein